MTAPTLHGSLLDILGLEITAGVQGPGAVLRIEDLERRFGVSRTVVRESMRILESMRLVSSRRRVGIIVQPRSCWNVFDPRVIRWRLAGSDRSRQLRSLTDLRAAVEPVAASGAAQNASPEQSTRLVELSQRMTEVGSAGDLLTFLRLDIEFHSLVLHSSGNEMFAALSDAIAEVLTGRTIHDLMPPRPQAEAMRLHRVVATSIRDADRGTAEAAMRGIMAEVGEHLTHIAPATPSATV